MATATLPDRPRSKRRTPRQRRSRERVERIVDAAGELVAESGASALTTRACAIRADVPIATLYQYFADRDEILVELMERHAVELDAEIAEAVGRLDRLSIRTVVEAAMTAFVDVCRRRPDLAAVWWRGRTVDAVTDYCRAHHEWVARELFGLFRQAGLLRSDTEPIIGELAVQVGDRAFELAFKDDLRGDPQVLVEGIELMIVYLERYATPAGLTGIDRADGHGRHASA